MTRCYQQAVGAQKFMLTPVCREALAPPLSMYSSRLLYHCHKYSRTWSMITARHRHSAEPSLPGVECCV